MWSPSMQCPGPKKKLLASIEDTKRTEKEQTLTDTLANGYRFFQRCGRRLIGAWTRTWDGSAGTPRMAGLTISTRSSYDGTARC